MKRSSADYSPPSKLKHTSLVDVLHGFANETTAHGIPRIIDRPKLISKIFWSVLVIVAFVVFFWQTYQLAKNYYAFNTKINLINSQSVAFPAVTVCNLNRLKRSKLINSDRWTDVLMYETDYDDTYYDTQSSEHTSPIDKLEPSFNPENGNVTSATSNDTEENTLARNKRPVSDRIGRPSQIPTPTRQELTDMGHRAEDLILECKFNNRKCDHTDFITTQNQEYGNCFTFNGDSHGGSFKRITKTGSKFGLHMTLYIEHSEYVGALTKDIGVRIMTHPRDIMPNPEDVGLSLSPGFSTNMGIRQVEIKRLPHPHGSCTNGEDKNYLMNNRYNYSILSCQKKCFLNKMASDCNCVVNSYDDYKGIQLCNQTQRHCRQRIEKLYYSESLECDCPAPCRETIYNTQTTFSVWPEDRYYNYLSDDIFKSKKYDAYFAMNNIFDARQNLVQAKIYFQELNYELVEQVPANTNKSLAVRNVSYSRLVREEGTDIESAAQGRQGQYWQPFILSLGPELNPKQFFIVADKLAIPTGTEA
ncbi:putative amiloride-sensitive sodium channel subunit alpha [Apostichopus japonicus]|uniref:Putative amiloride-sensitive sodium channel subunit alpha n=1 Tax=Stichopus japonicus TaxID=307972 RepID=A0A2G8JQL9_STIJA|nr:putative amiloride-sensitive sodium channel subunit alpha [Apostichopus japonicus]